jgi:hypothetical protein
LFFNEAFSPVEPPIPGERVLWISGHLRDVVLSGFGRAEHAHLGRDGVEVWTSPVDSLETETRRRTRGHASSRAPGDPRRQGLVNAMATHDAGVMGPPAGSGD